MTTKTNIRKACEDFLLDWNRHDWMADHGEWASENWNSEREKHDTAHEELAETLAAVPDALDKVPEAARLVSGSSAYSDVRATLEAALEALDAAEATANALESQVCFDDQDYIAEGVIDPDGIVDEVSDLDVGASWQGWDCKEGWGAYQVGEALYLNWWRLPYGGTNRHERDLWVCVDETFFQCDESEAQ